MAELARALPTSLSGQNTSETRQTVGDLVFALGAAGERPGGVAELAPTRVVVVAVPGGGAGVAAGGGIGEFLPSEPQGVEPGDGDGVVSYQTGHQRASELGSAREKHGPWRTHVVLHYVAEQQIDAMTGAEREILDPAIVRLSLEHRLGTQVDGKLCAATGTTSTPASRWRSTCSGADSRPGSGRRCRSRCINSWLYWLILGALVVWVFCGCSCGGRGHRGGSLTKRY